MTVRDIIYAVVLAAGVLALFASFAGVDVSDPPPQHTSPITGFPTWHQTYENEVQEITMSFTMLALLFSAGAAYAARRATGTPSRSLTGFVTLKTGNEEASTQINQFILYYIDATWLAVLAYLFFDVGKIWAVVGALHNLLEVALLIILHSGGRVNSMSFGLYMFLYVCVTILLSVYLKWPLDAIFFRWQGLCSDFALIVVFTRTYFATKSQLNAFGSADKHDQVLARAQRAAEHLEHEQEQARNAASASSSSSHSANPPNLVLPAATSAATPAANGSSSHHLHSSWKKFIARAPLPEHHSTNGRTAENASLTPPTPQEARFAGAPAHVIDFLPTNSNGAQAVGSTVSVVALNQDPSIWGVQWHNPNQILLLVAASVFHVLGNCVTTIWITSTYAMAAFQISYGISYPLYAYYLYVDNHALRQTKVYLADFAKIKTFQLACLAVIGATATVRAGLYVSTQVSNGGSL